MGEESPKNKVKFLCSYGGKVLPRPSDGILKYVGGETRVICVPRDVTFSELMKKVSGIVDIGEVVLKYQLVPEELDALVSVRTQEDVKHMMEEQDRHESVGSPMLRAFLFPTKPLLVDNNQQVQVHQPVPVEPYLLEQRYIDAINGIIRSPSPRGGYSACCSPKSNSPDGHTTTSDSPFHPSHSLNQNLNLNRTGHLTMHKVHSSPTLSNLTSTSNNNNNNIQLHHDHHAIAHYHHPLPYPPSSTSPFASRQDPQIGMGMGGGGGGRVPPVITTDRSFNYYYSTATRQHKPCAYHEDSVAPYATGSSGGGHVMIERVHSVPRSQSPRKAIWE